MSKSAKIRSKSLILKDLGVRTKRLNILFDRGDRML